MDQDKKIVIGSSSLVDLKAELHRKQQESRTLRREGTSNRPSSKSSESSAKSSSKSRVWSKANAGVEKRDQRDREEVEQENKDLERSRAVLEAKARLYDRLQNSTDALEDDATNERFLVNFQQKTIDDVTRRQQRRQVAAEGSSAESPPPPPAAEEEEWVEFTDSLGRSRTVMRRDLEEYRRRDREARRPTDEQTPELMSEDQRREKQRQVWEQQELENAAKRDIHYQDVLFNEARAHGAGYFAFSQDAEERARQRAELDELRDNTETQQSRAELARKRKNKQLKERLRKVRERKRLKLGLPIEDRLEKSESESDSEESQKTAPAPAELTPEEISRRLEEQRREHDRQSFVREWDRGKDGVARKSVLTQEEWVERQRRDRPAEFAPPAQYEPRRQARGRAPQSGPAGDPSSGGRGPVTQGGHPPPHTERGGTERRQAEPAAQAATGAAAKVPADTGQRPEMAQPQPGQGYPPPGMGQPPPSIARPPPNTGQLSPNLGQPPPTMGQPPPNLGQPLPNMGQPPPNLGQPLPNMGQPPPNLGQPPPNMGQPPPNLEQPPPNLGQPPPNLRQPPPNMLQPPPNMRQPPPNTGLAPPIIGHPPGPGHISVSLSDPAAGCSQIRAGVAGPGRLPGRPAATERRPGRAASHRARQAAAADLPERGEGVEVAPPPTAEYYGGTGRGRRPPVTRPDVGGAIEAGLALLSRDTEHKHNKTFDV